MLYNLIQKRRGKETVVMTDELPKVRDRMKQLRGSQRKGVGRNQDRVEYRVEPATDDDEKYKKPPHDMYLGGQPRKHPRVPKK